MNGAGRITHARHARTVNNNHALFRPDLVTVFFGANDNALPADNLRQHVPLAEYGANMVKIVTHIRETGAKVLIIAPPPCAPQERDEKLDLWPHGGSKMAHEVTPPVRLLFATCFFRRDKLAAAILSG